MHLVILSIVTEKDRLGNDTKGLIASFQADCIILFPSSNIAGLAFARITQRFTLVTGQFARVESTIRVHLSHNFDRPRRR